MKSRLIIDGNSVYELDEECLLQKKLPLPEGAATFSENRDTPLVQKAILPYQTSSESDIS